MEDIAPNIVDRHVGSRVRMRRHEMGLSQEQLASRLGVTFQQVQKYERAVNRISASRLFDISRALDVPVSTFFVDLDRIDQMAPGVQETSSDYREEILEMLMTNEGQALALAFSQISTSATRGLIVALAQRLAQADQMMHSSLQAGSSI
ncbi:MAG TPA: transcriptional regulator [Hyphomonadaceae bacterium]|nr:transcriptional regulator [Hyphomonadaceae bacterium]